MMSFAVAPATAERKVPGPPSAVLVTVMVAADSSARHNAAAMPLGGVFLLKKKIRVGVVVVGYAPITSTHVLTRLVGSHYCGFCRRPSTPIPGTAVQDSSMRSINSRVRRAKV